MADVDNGIHDYLVATAEEDEAANRRWSHHITCVLILVFNAGSAVLCPIAVYYGITAAKLPLWHVAAIPFFFLMIVVLPLWTVRHTLWTAVCELFNPEEEMQIDADGCIPSLGHGRGHAARIQPEEAQLVEDTA